MKADSTATVAMPENHPMMNVMNEPSPRASAGLRDEQLLRGTVHL
jgi:hypothetical protein